MSSLMQRFARLVKFEHTIFALPFAYAGMLLAADSLERSIEAGEVLWITVAMIGARSLAMALNRLIDAGIDARNPRTAVRELPSGALSTRQVWAFIAVSAVVLLLATAFLDPVTRYLWPIPVTMFVIYPYLKRFTWLCHLFLGLTVGLAPTGAWLAVTGAVGLIPLVLTGAIALWVAGFDIIYASQDREFDAQAGLVSIPVRFGVATGLWITRVAHAGTVAALVWVGVSADLGPIYFGTVAIVAGLLAYENSLVSAKDMSRADAAFFTVNGVIGVIYAVGVVLALWVA